MGIVPLIVAMLLVAAFAVGDSPVTAQPPQDVRTQTASIVMCIYFFT
ncbi:MAG: hypothetical protein PQ971_03340 [Methanobacterium sp.]